MILDFADSYFLLNNELSSTENSIDLDEKPDSVVYEVMKVIAGIPLFYEDHFKRLKQSCQLANFKNYQLNHIDFPDMVKLLCEKNQKYFGTIELRIVTGEDKTDTVLGFTSHTYPQPTDYLHGVSVEILHAERDIPNAKLKYTELRIEANNYLNNNPNIAELLLANSDGYLTEGSRSNLFFIHKNKVYTAPGNLVLKGITRKYILQVLDSLNVELVEEMVHENEIIRADAAFICGTSRGALPIKNIGDVDFDPQHPIIKELLIEFNQLIQNYLSSVEL